MQPGTSLFRKPSFILLCFIPFLLWIAYGGPNQTTDINIHDTYFAVSIVDLSFICISLILFLSLLHRALRLGSSSKSNIFDFFHVFLSGLSLCLLLLLLRLRTILNPEDVTLYNTVSGGLFFSGMMVLILQPLFGIYWFVRMIIKIVQSGKS